jgi:DNA-binding SARP family transcriptional activator
LCVSRVEIRVLGGFEVSVDGRRVPAQAWQQRRASELVKLLALAPRHRLQREQVIDALWPDLPLDAGAANLRKAAHYARAALGSKEAVVLRQVRSACGRTPSSRSMLSASRPRANWL